MIVLDTHVWVWWASDPDRLTAKQAALIKGSEGRSIAVSSISCWEIAMLVARGRLKLGTPLLRWLNSAIQYPGFEVVDLLPEIVAASVALPGDFHKDPADQLIVATSRVLGARLVTSDRRILEYEHVQAVA